ncbi:MAG: MliC family protein [Pseudomonadota bacterium]
MSPRLFLTAALMLSAGAGTALAAAPAFDCRKATGEIQPLICGTPELSALDRRASEVFAQALPKTDSRGRARLRAEQRGWIKGRDDCWKADDKPACVKDAYVRRIAELQATYRLVPAIGPVRFQCDGNAAKEVVATFFRTDPPTAVAEFGDQSSMMYAAPSGSGARYVGRNEQFWEHQGEARVTWGYGAPEMVCRKRP